VSLVAVISTQVAFRRRLARPRDSAIRNPEPVRGHRVAHPARDDARTRADTGAHRPMLPLRLAPRAPERFRPSLFHVSRASVLATVHA